MLTYRIVFLIFSLFIQIIAAIFALRLISLTKKATAWLFISSAIIFMACRRIVTLMGIFIPSHGKMLRWITAESIALIISSLMLIGIFLIANIFRERLLVEDNLKNEKDRSEFLSQVLRAIRNINQLIVREKNINKLMNAACDILIKTRNYRFVWVELIKEGSCQVISIGKTVSKEEYPPEINITWDNSDYGNRPIGRAIKNRKPFIMRDIEHDPRFIPWRKDSLKKGYGSFVALPLIATNKVFGALNVYAEAADAFDDDELNLLEEVAGDLAFAIQIIKDEQARNRAEEELQEYAGYVRNLIEVSLDPLVTISSNGIITDINKASEKAIGLPRKELIGTEFSNYFTEPSKAKAIYQKVLAEEFVRDYPLEIRHRNGSVTPVLYNASVYKGRQGSVIGVFAAARDITKRKQIEAELRLFLQAAESSIDGIAIADLNGKLSYLNNSYAKMFGYSKEELMDMEIAFTYAEDQKQKLEEAIDTTMQDGWTGELTGKRKDGTFFFISVSASRVLDEQGKLIALMAVLRDVTYVKKMEVQVRQSQKMEAIGTLAGGIAHDFNNLLVPIIGFTELILSDLPADSELRDDLIQVLKASERAKNLIMQILSFSRKTNGKREPINLSVIIKEALKLLRSTLPTTIEIRQNISHNLKTVKADPTQIHQILMNLCTNAYHAMTEGGILEISLANAELDENVCTEFNGLTPGSYIKLSVKDTGCGMDTDTMKRIYDPFFTTKDYNKGTGMGLSVVYGIVKSHRGDISVYSKPGVGTTFHIYLPVTESIEELRLETSKTIQGGTESILLVDDEIAVTEIGKKILERLGYKIITMTSSVEALELFRLKSDEFDLVITDHTMPYKTGVDLAVEMLKIRPDIPIILCTGYNSIVTPEKAHELGIRKFVMKPIVGAELSRTVRLVLDGKPK